MCGTGSMVDIAQQQDIMACPSLRTGSHNKQHICTLLYNVCNTHLSTAQVGTRDMLTRDLTVLNHSHTFIHKCYKKSSGDEIANVNFFRTTSYK